MRPGIRRPLRRRLRVFVAPAAVGTAEKLLLLPDAGIARTKEPVTLESPEGRAHATGMELDNHARILRLDRVNATYQPSSRRREAAR